MRALDHFLIDHVPSGAAVYDVDGRFWWTVVSVEPGEPVVDIRYIEGREVPVFLAPTDYTLVAKNFAVIKGCTRNRRAILQLHDMSEKTADLLAEAMITLAAKQAPVIDSGTDPALWFRSQDMDLVHVIEREGTKIALSHPEFVGNHVIDGRRHGLLLHGGIARIGHIPTSWERILSD